MAPIEEVKAAIAAFPGAVLEDDVAHQIYPQAINAVGSRDTFVGRIRKELTADLENNLKQLLSEIENKEEDSIPHRPDYQPSGRVFELPSASREIRDEELVNYP